MHKNELFLLKIAKIAQSCPPDPPTEKSWLHYWYI